MESVIIASVILASVTIMASVTYGKCILANVVKEKVLWQMKLSRWRDFI